MWNNQKCESNCNSMESLRKVLINIMYKNNFLDVPKRYFMISCSFSKTCTNGTFFHSNHTSIWFFFALFWPVSLECLSTTICIHKNSWNCWAKKRNKLTLLNAHSLDIGFHLNIHKHHSSLADSLPLSLCLILIWIWNGTQALTLL